MGACYIYQFSQILLAVFAGILESTNDKRRLPRSSNKKSEIRIIDVADKTIAFFHQAHLQDGREKGSLREISGFDRSTTEWVTFYYCRRRRID
jgi:hypothetical protein